MAQLARRFGTGPASLTDIADEEDLPRAYLEQLVISLRDADLVQSTRGAHGGYVQMDNNPLLVPSTRITWPADGKLVNLQNLSSVYYLNPNVAIPYVQQWNFGFGFEFGKNYGAGEHGAEQCAAAHFIHARHGLKAARPQFSFQ